MWNLKNRPDFPMIGDLVSINKVLSIHPSFHLLVGLVIDKDYESDIPTLHIMFPNGASLKFVDECNVTIRSFA